MRDEKFLRRVTIKILVNRVFECVAYTRRKWLLVNPQCTRIDGLRGLRHHFKRPKVYEKKKNENKKRSWLGFNTFY